MIDEIARTYRPCIGKWIALMWLPGRHSWSSSQRHKVNNPYSDMTSETGKYRVISTFVQSNQVVYFFIIVSFPFFLGRIIDREHSCVGCIRHRHSLIIFTRDQLAMKVFHRDDSIKKFNPSRCTILEVMCSGKKRMKYYSFNLTKHKKVSKRII